MLVARLSSQARPPLPVPKRLRSILRFARLPASARSVVRRSLDEDPEFRARVAVGADEAGLPRPSWLFLRRPEGWEQELASLVRDSLDADEDAEKSIADRALRRRLGALEESTLRLEAAVAIARAEAAGAAGELVEERRLRRLSDDRRAALERRADSLESERDSARRRAEIDEQRIGALVLELDEMRGRFADATIVIDRLGGERETAVATAALAGSGRSRLLERVEEMEMVLGLAAKAAAELVTMLDRRKDPASATSSAACDDRLQEQGSAAPTAARATPSRRERAARPRQVATPRWPGGREPHSLPGGVFDDSARAASHLIRVPRMLVLVDGYNATLSVWADLSIAEQRSRLIDACGELSARTGVELIVVFDGADLGPSQLAPGAKRGVRWWFSPAGVEADDVLLDYLDGVDVSRPVTVASDDRRVRDGALDRGANSISTAQLFAVLGRGGGDRG